MTEICEHCGAKVARYWHKLTPGLVGTLVKVYKKICEKGENTVHKNELDDLDHSEYGNFQKLRFHALIAKYKPNGEWIRGSWLITKRGALFLKGMVEVPDRVQTFRNKVEAHSDRLVNVSQVMKSDPYWEEYNDFVQQQADPEFLDLPEVEVEDIKKIKIQKKKKGKEYCPKCDTQLKKMIVETTFPNGGVKYSAGYKLVCPNCNYEHKNN